jgi:hypothetical protein
MRVRCLSVVRRCMIAIRTATIHLIIAVLLACPYVCLSHAAAMPQSARSSGGCTCCSRPVPQNSKSCPVQPERQQRGGTCLCHGAVMDRQTHMPGLERAIVLLEAPDAPAIMSEPLAVERVFWTGWVASHFPTADSGREVRALIASLLL